MKMLARDIIKAAKTQSRTVNVATVVVVIYAVLASSSVLNVATAIKEKCYTIMETTKHE